MSAEYPDRCCTNKRNRTIKVFFCNDTEVKFNFSEFREYKLKGVLCTVQYKIEC